LHVPRVALRPHGAVPDTEVDTEPSGSEGSGSEDAICTICFEPKPFVTVPCSCKLNYCSCCWDRALAMSVTTRGRAQCPSCRMSFRVDYDPYIEGLVFSKTTESTSLADWRERLYKKEKPVQIRLLEDFGTTCKKKGFQWAQYCDATSISPDGASSPASVSTCSTLSSTQPVCVCGSVLERLATRDRIVRMMDDTQPGWRTRVTDPESLVQSLAVGSLITCELCDEVATVTGFVWTCKSGPYTMLHPAAYDVCEKCFMHHAHKRQPEPLATSSMESTCRSQSASMQGPEGMRRSDSFAARARRTVSSMVPNFLSDSPTGMSNRPGGPARRGSQTTPHWPYRA